MANPFYVQPADYSQALQGAAGAVDKFGQQQYRDRARQALQTAVQSGDPVAMRNAALEFPEISETMQQMFNFTNDQTRQVATETYRRALSDPDNAESILSGGIETVGQLGGTPTTMNKDLEMYRRNPEAFFKNARIAFAGMDPKGYDAAFGGAADTPAGTREFQALLKAAKSADPMVRRAARVKLRIDPPASLSAEERIALNKATGQAVVEQAGAEAAAKEQGKLESQARLLPNIRAQVKEAEAQAASRGETLSELSRAETALPGLKDMVNKLASLSQVATYTTTGKIRDTLVKEFGFGSTEGSTARAQIESIVDNEILPLLKQTFGAQFTEKEGDRLIRTLMDIDAPPAEKLARLNAFYETKVKEVGQLRERAEAEQGQSNESPSMSDEEADAFINQMLEQ